MTDVIVPSPAAAHRPPRPQVSASGEPSSQPRAIPQKKPAGGFLDVASPVNQNGSFEFDRVLKSGEVGKRSRRTKQWKRFHLVLRPNLLSIYKNASEDKLHKQIALSDLTAVAALKDPKGRRAHMFGLFSPARNYHFQASSDAEARQWVELISREARIDEEEELMVPGSPVAEGSTIPGWTDRVDDVGRRSTSSPEPVEPSIPYRTKDGVSIPGIRRTSFQENDYSGAEHLSYSDFSDAAPSRPCGEPSTLPSGSPFIRPPSRPKAIRNTSRVSANGPDDDEERVIWHGNLLALKSKGGVRQWKKLWVVVRRKHVAFYKNEEEYSAHLIIPMSNIINAVEVDAISRSKAHCLQIIAEEKSYRFCARDEESLLRCLGAVKSQLARRKEREAAQRAVP